MSLTRVPACRWRASSNAVFGKRTIPFLVLELIFDLPPDDALDDLRGRHLTEPLGEKLLSVAQDGDAVGNPVNLVHSVGDVDDRDSACLQPCRLIAKSASVSCLARLAVGSSMISTWASWASAFAISVSCQYAVLRLPSTAPGIDVDLHLLEDLGGPLAGFPVVDQATTAQGFRGEVDVLRNGQGGDQAELLEHHADAGGPGTVDGGVGRGLAIYQDLALRRACTPPEGSSSGSTCRRRCRRQGHVPHPWRPRSRRRVEPRCCRRTYRCRASRRPAGWCRRCRPML